METDEYYGRYEADGPSLSNNIHHIPGEILWTESKTTEQEKSEKQDQQSEIGV